MEALSFECRNCGGPVKIDFRTRKGICEWCQGEVTFPRKTFNSDDKVQKELELCGRCFLEKRFEEAKSHAENVLAVAIDNAPALYARAYYESFTAINKNTERLTDFLNQLIGIKEIDFDEVELLKKMFLSTVYKLDSHEEYVLRWALENLAAPELCAFTDVLSPALIGKKTSIDFFTPELAEVYIKISSECSIPKTCYALLQAITTNPDSPYPNNRFFLKTKTLRFYQEFVLPIGEIIQNMASQELREKFYRVYQTKQEDLKNKMIGGTN